jgi:hypothetical protein
MSRKIKQSRKNDKNATSEALEALFSKHEIESMKRAAKHAYNDDSLAALRAYVKEGVKGLVENDITSMEDDAHLARDWQAWGMTFIPWMPETLRKDFEEVCKTHEHSPIHLLLGHIQNIVTHAKTSGELLTYPFELPRATKTA